ncbi:DUF4145 domain-containing protein [Legionella rowbothamii]|uniref:DUF4145 domain-containing protein n=1 Tax=Legionella rowbothamii TaxID=96229 RepID=UPI0010558696|nr:DUF4145 domain-containing protein [Legionella rowbothamii]
MHDSMEVGGRWSCPYCNQYTVLRDGDIFISSNSHHFLGSDENNVSYIFKIAKCHNPSCLNYTATISITEEDKKEFRGRYKDVILNIQIMPLSEAKIFPSYIPEEIIEDYSEAYNIKDLSPKASATLARRCIQNVIHDFWNVHRANLYDEIEALSNIDDSLVLALHDVRKIGNIGAHMKTNTNEITKIEKEEAGILLKLIEILFEETYIKRHTSQEIKDRLTQIVETKFEK